MLRLRRLGVGLVAVLVTVGLQTWPSLPAQAAPGWQGKVQQAESVAVRDAAKSKRSGRSGPGGYRSAKTSWPAAGQASLDLVGKRRGQPVRAGGLPVRISVPEKATRPVGKTTVRVLDRPRSAQLVGDGVVTVVETEAGAQSEVRLDYSDFAAAGGAGFGSRLRLVALPSCALVSPEKPECQTQTDLGASNAVADEELSAVVMAAAADAVGTAPSVLPADASAVPVGASPAAAVMVMAAVAAVSGDQGDYGQTPLRASSAWSSGEVSGAFSWGYPMGAPPVPSGVIPEIGISYSSGGTDGGVSNTNNQASWVGEGFDLGSAFIERKYDACADDKSGGNNASASTGDLCWFTDPKKTNNEKWDNAFLAMDGHSGELVRDGNTANWRLEVDDGTRVTKIGNPADGNEYWRVTMPDGTQYFFGKGKSDAAAGVATNSKWAVPVAGNHSGEPGYKAAFKDSLVSQPWRWNLDYVVSPAGNTMTYFYVKEVNKYKLNLVTSTSYDRGGYLSRVQYGERKGAETNNASPAKVEFVVDERCDTTISSTCKTVAVTAATAKAWPDVPMDAVCDTYCPSQKTSPTFFSRKRLAQVDTYTRNAAGTAWEAVDSWVLTSSFPKPADGGAVPSIWPASITRTAKAGTAISLPSTTLVPIMLDSRIKGSGATALEKPRLAMITAETGAETIIEYSKPDCTSVNVPATANISTNTTRCMPVYYSSGTAAPTLQWFNKYVVTSVTERDPVSRADVNLTGLGLDISADEVTTYSYDGGGAWRYDDSPILSSKYRTWSQWRGYGKITTSAGSGTTKTITEDRYFRGMNGDKAASGTKSVTVTDSSGVTWADEDFYAGMVRESRTFTGAGGVEDSAVVTDPYAKTLFSDGRLSSRQVDEAKTLTRQRISGGGVRTGIDRILERDGYGQPTTTESLGDTAVAGDETCTRLRYATPAVAATDPIDRVAETSVVPLLCQATATTAQVLSATRHYYGTSAQGTVTSPGLETKQEELMGSGNDRAWVATLQGSHDQWGRIVRVVGPLGDVATTAYTHTTGGLLSAKSLTTADPDGTGPGVAMTSTTTYDPRLGASIKSVAAGGQVTEATYDALGRQTATWQPGRSKATQSANQTLAYTISKTAPSTVTTKTLLPDGAKYATSVVLLDSMLRQRQTQTDAPTSGRIIIDTRYDSRGNPVLTDRYFNATAPGTTLVQPSLRESIRTSNRTSYDFANRETRNALYSAEILKWDTKTSHEGDRTATTPPTGGTPITAVNDIHGRLTARIEHLGATTSASGITTRYEYDPAGQLVKMIDTKGNTWAYTYDLAGNRISAKDPDAGLSTSTYDVAGQRTSSTDARGITLKFAYDRLGRQTKTTKADGTPLSATEYDTLMKGMPTSTSRHLPGGVVTQKIDSYDTAGRATKTTLKVPAITGLIPTEVAGDYTNDYSFNPDGSLNTQTLPAAGGLPAETLTHGYTALGLPQKLTGKIGTTPATYVTDTQYLQYGTISAMIFGTHTGKASMTTFGRDTATLALNSIEVLRQTSPGVVDERTELTRNPAGNITQVKATLPGGIVDNQCFAYDYQQQLTQAWTPNAASCDPDTRSTTTLGGPAPYWTSWDTDTTGKTRNRTDRTPTTQTKTTLHYPTDGADAVTPHFVTGTTTTTTTGNTEATYTADAAGNTTTRTTSTGTQQNLVWNEENQLTEIHENNKPIAQMVYGVDGNRLLRKETDTTTLYLGNTEIKITATGTIPPTLPTNTPKTTTTTRYYTHAGQTIAARTGTNNDTITTLINDHQGTTHHQINNATATLQTTWQNPYGQTRSTPTTTWTGERSFVGGTKDATGLIRIGARDYDPQLQHFITTDPLQNLTDPLQWNPYLYANNNPTTNTDPTGLLYRPGPPPPVCTPFPPPTKPAPQPKPGKTRRTPTNTIRETPEKRTPAPRSGNSQNGGSRGIAKRAPHKPPRLFGFFNPTWNLDIEETRQGMHLFLDLLGLIPGYGEIADIVNAVWYAAEGNWEDAAWSAGGAIPIAGWGATAGKLIRKGPKVVEAITGAAKKATKEADDWPVLSGIVRDAAKGKGNFGLGSGTLSQAQRAGQSWVGEGAKWSRDGKALISQDGLRQWRPPTYKPNLGRAQSNFQSRLQPRGEWQGNGHLDITDWQ